MTVDTMPKFLAHIQRRLDAEFDFVLPVLGEEGSGKSHTAMALGYALDDTYSWDRHEFSGPTYVEQMKKLPENRAGCWDEMTHGGLRLRTMAEEEVNSLRHIVQGRHHLHVHLFCVPYPELALKYFTAKRAPWRIWCNRKPEWNFSILEVEEAQRSYNRFKDEFYTWWRTQFRYRLDPVLIGSHPWKRYQAKKDDWTRRLDRDTEQALDERTTSEQRDTLDQWRQRFARLPNKVRRFYHTFIERPIGESNGSGLKPSEEKVRPLIEQHLEA